LYWGTKIRQTKKQYENSEKVREKKMLRTEKELVFIEANEIVKEYEDTGVKKVFRIAKFANPTTFENFSLPYSEKIDASRFTKGEKVHLRLEISEGYKSARILVVDIIPVLQAK
jgi:hypothetical protein